MTIQRESSTSNLSTYQDGAKNKEQSSSWTQRTFKIVTENPGYALWGLSLALDPIKYLFTQLGIKTPFSDVSHRVFSTETASDLWMGAMSAILLSGFITGTETSDQSENDSSKARHGLSALFNLISFLSPNNAGIKSLASTFNGLNLAMDFIVPPRPLPSSKQRSTSPSRPDLNKPEIDETKPLSSAELVKKWKQLMSEYEDLGTQIDRLDGELNKMGINSEEDLEKALLTIPGFSRRYRDCKEKGYMLQDQIDQIEDIKKNSTSSNTKKKLENIIVILKELNPNVRKILKEFSEIIQGLKDAGYSVNRATTNPRASQNNFENPPSIDDVDQNEEPDLRTNLQNIREITRKFRDALDAKLIGQTEAKDTVVRAVIRHLMTADLEDPKRATVLLLGPTGTGKTTLVKALSEVTDRPFVVVDGSSLTPEGYVGNSFSDTWERLLEAAGGDQEKAEQGIVFIDEVDKIFKSTEGRSNANQVIQNQLLKALEGSDVQIPNASKTMNTKKMVFFLGGAFEGLARDKEANGVTLDQLEEYGLSREFTGRISNIAQLNSLDAKQLKEVLKQEKGVASIPNWQKEFLGIGAELLIDEDVLDRIVSYAVQRKTGVRGVDFVLRQLLTPLLYKTIEDVFEKLDEAESDDSPLKVQVTLADWSSSELVKAENSRNTFPSLDEIQGGLKKKVVGQDKAKAVIAEAVYNHHLNVKLGLNLPKGNVLMIGPSGCGKTYMMEVLSEETGLPLANIDASKLTRAGYVGGSPEDAIVRLLEQTGGDVSAAEKGIIFLDEMDKQFEDVANPFGGGLTGRPILNQLLKMMQGDKVTVQYKGKSKTVDTTNVLFVMAGAFSKFPELYEKEKLEDNDLLSCGITPEFLGRTGYVTQLEQLNAIHYREYLVGMGENSLITNWINAFEKMGAELLVEDEVIDEIIEKALKTKTGLRGLQNILRQLLSPKVLETQKRITAGESNLLVHIVKENEAVHPSIPEVNVDEIEEVD